MAFAPLTADTTSKTADSTVLTADMTQYALPNVIGGAFGRVPSRIQIEPHPDDPRDISVKVRARLTLTVKARAFGSVEHAVVVIPAPTPQPKPTPQPVIVPGAILSVYAHIAAALRADASATATVNRAFTASGAASFSLEAVGLATGALEPELMSPEALLALLTALDDVEKENA